MTDDGLADLAGRLPFPLQLAVESVDSSSSLVRLMGLLDVAEVAAKFVVTVGAAEFRFADLDPLDLPERPSLVDWLQRLGSISNAIEEHRLHPLLGGLGKATASLSSFARNTELVQDRPRVQAKGGFALGDLRNWLYHAGGATEARSRIDAERVERLLLPALETIAEVFAPGELLRVVPDGTCETMGRPATPPLGARAAPLAPGLYLRLPGADLQIWPVFRHDRLGLEAWGLPADDLVTQVFVRLERDELHYAPYGHDAIYGRAEGEGPKEGLRDLFQLRGRGARGHVDHGGGIETAREAEELPQPDSRSLCHAISDFTAEIDEKAVGVVGRERDTEHLIDCLRDPETRIWWLWGALGRGKSALVAAAAARLEADRRLGDRPIVVHLFKAGDGERCSTEGFEHLALEGLGKGDGRTVSAEERLGDLRRLLAERDPLVICDGLDELERAEKGGCARLAELARYGGRWLFSGRPEENVVAALATLGATPVWENGLPDMTEGAMRELFFGRCPPVVRNAIFSVTKDLDEQSVSNPYVEALLEKAQGSPLYLRLLLDWLARLDSVAEVKGEIAKVVAAPSLLPEGLDALYAKLVESWGLGDIQALKTPALCLLARSRTPLDAESLARLAYYNFPPGDDAEAKLQHERADKVIAAFGPVLRPAYDEDDKQGWALDHDSFRQFLAHDENFILTWNGAARLLADAAEHMLDEVASAPEQLSRHLFRHGVAYLIDRTRLKAALDALCSLRYLYERLAMLGVEAVNGLIGDFSRLLDGREDLSLPEAAASNAQAWQNLIRRHAHHLRHEIPGWPSERTLYQLAYDSPEGSSMANEADQLSTVHGPPPLHLEKRPKHQTHRMATLTLAGHTSLVNGALLLPEERVLSWSHDDSLRVWDLATGTELARMQGHASRVNGALLLPEDRVFSWSSDRTLRVWDATSGMELKRMEGHTGEIGGALLLPEERVLSWSRHETLRVWDLVTGTEVARMRGHTYSVKGALLLSEDRVLSWSEDRTLRVWDLVTATEVGCLKGHTDSVEGALLLPEDRALSWSHDGTLRVWDLATGTELARMDTYTDWTKGPLLLPDYRVLTSIGEVLSVWDLVTATEVARMRGHTEWVNGTLLLSENRVLSWSNDRTLRVWDLVTATEVGCLKGHTDSVAGALLLPEDRVLSWSHDGTLRVWDLATGTELARMEGYASWVNGALLLSNERVLSWSGDHTLQVWDFKTGDVLNTEERAGTLNGALLLSENRVLSWSDDYTLQVWDLTTGSQVARMEGHTSWVKGALILPEDRALSWSRDHTLRVWDLATGVELARMEREAEGVEGTLLLPEGRALSWSDSWSDDDTLRVWDLATDVELARMEGHTSWVDGALLLSNERALSWSGDHTLRVWDLATGVELARMEGHASFVHGALILPEERILSWSNDRTLRVWDPATGTENVRMKGHTDSVEGAILLPQARALSWSKDRTLRVWDLVTGDELARMEGHAMLVKGALLLSNERVLSWSDDGTLRVWDSTTADQVWCVSPLGAETYAAVYEQYKYGGTRGSLYSSDSLIVFDPSGRVTAYLVLDGVSHELVLEQPEGFVSLGPDRQPVLIAVELQVSSVP
jgi:WD40 repeat protein